MIKAIFFDFDGTISDAMGIGYESMIRAFNDFGYEFDKKKLRGLLGKKMPLIFDGLGLDKKNFDACHKRFYEYFMRAALDGGIKPCVSLKPLWKMKESYPLVVVSNSETSFLDASIKKLGIKGLFDGVYGSDKFSSKDKLLKKLFREMKIKPSEAIYIGDTFSDVDFARDAGCIAVAIHNKCAWSSLKEILKEKPDYVVRDFYGFKKVIDSLEKGN